MTRNLAFLQSERPAQAVTASQMRALTPAQWQAHLAGPPEDVARWLRAGALYGLVEAQTALGQILLDGRGVGRDDVAAAGWFAVAAQAGYAPACNMLGRCRERGWGVAVDTPRAAASYRQAAELGLAWGEYNLANMLLRGRGVTRDRAQAFAWFSRAAVQGHAKSMNLVGRFHEEGWEMRADLAAARGCYQRAADGGDFRGQYNLASLLAADGDITGAVMWLHKAMASAPVDFLAVMARRLVSSASEEVRALGEMARKKAGLF